MASYIVGDIQGCFDELQLLLKQVDFDPKKDTLYLVGDLVARGEQSLETLRWVKDMGDSARTVLGNHDLHLLATYLGVHKPKASDKTLNILQAPDVDELMEWLRQQPLLIEEDEFLVCHAGISPQWDLDTARESAHFVEKRLQSDKWKRLIKRMYRNTPSRWRNDLKGIKRRRYIINAFTRMRFCRHDGRLLFSCKNHPKDINAKQALPWYLVPNRPELGKTVLFGHWAALMGCDDKKADVIGLDTGCVWGEHLSMLRWEDKTMFEQKKLLEQKKR